MIVLIATISVVAAFFITNAIFGASEEEAVTVKSIDRIESTVDAPNQNIFNAEAINPAVEVQIDSGEE